ncbi:NHLP-related RiPP peptide [Tahibacter amnicola]|uniref:NHLP-related RiPP peptide n=1 Tax=Tahibacter amnicola TaxID=2976241 RepID=A0ABY6BFH2_9GAMM|nr:NHLP-related RiPP peptide [Tahibacter amnicola]UXI68514.1 NHLP-related RiPP peptide [Tahibacter amnicola]
MASLSRDQVDQLLNKLSTDDAFRELLTNDPAAALRSIGAPVELAACFAKTKGLASKETIRRSAETLQGQLTGKLQFNVHGLALD